MHFAPPSFRRGGTGYAGMTPRDPQAQLQPTTAGSAAPDANSEQDSPAMVAIVSAAEDAARAHGHRGHDATTFSIGYLAGMLASILDAADGEQGAAVERVRTVLGY